MPHAFLSYSRKDSAFVDRLERDLKAQGFDTWRDQSSIAGGEDWYKSIVQGLHEAYVVLCVVTPAADESRWVLREALYADQQRIPLLPVLPAPHKIPFHLISTQPIECYEAAFDTGFARLVAALRAMNQTPRTSRPVPELKPNDRATENAYLDFLLGEMEADLRSAMYVSLLATPEKAAQKLYHPGLPGGRRPSLERLGIERLHSDAFDKPGETVPDARIPLRDLKRVILLGDPGAGKTTTLLQLAVDLAQEAKNQPDTALLPVFIPLRAFQGQQPFAEFIRSQMATLQSQYERLLAEGRLVLLCDALNEMPRKAADGRDLVAEVRDYLLDKPHWVVSCRVRDYQEDLNSLQNVVKVRLKALDPPRIKQVIEKRFAHAPERGAVLWAEMKGTDELLQAWEALEQAGQGEAFWGREWPESVKPDKAVWPPGYWGWRGLREDRSRMLPLCRNPYMLFLAGEIFDLKGSLPANRGELFATFVDDLLAREEESCKATGAAWIDKPIILYTLSYLAFNMQMAQTGTEITSETVKRFILEKAGTLQKDFASTPTLSDASYVDLLIHLAVSANLLEIGEKARFTHQLLQEYFASEVMGIVMDAEQSATAFWSLENWWESQAWEETALILAGVRTDPEGVARWIAPAQPEMAYRVLTESGIEIDLSKIAEPTRSALLESARAKINEPNPVGRAAAYRVLGHFRADTRPGIGVISPSPIGTLNGEGAGRGVSLPDIAWCTVPAGKFLFGEDKREIEIPYSYQIAQYPVTYAQYEPFVAGDGYSNRDYWTDDGWKWRGDGTQPQYWNDPEWHIANHPVIGVTWYESVAFCNWLMAQLNPVVWRSAVGTQYIAFRPNAPGLIRLPTEAEWEKAARGTDGRVYPYGDEFDRNKGNTVDTGIGRTNTVGIFPAGESPYRALDMSGNVWEWCTSKYVEDYRYPEANDANGIDVRVLRGGGFNESRVYSRVAYRIYYLHPSFRNFNYGFRVVRVPPSP